MVQIAIDNRGDLDNQKINFVILYNLEIYVALFSSEAEWPLFRKQNIKLLPILTLLDLLA